jgi:Eukaryotic aspartyl protease
MKQNNLIETALQQGMLRENTFSLKLALMGASLFIGGLDNSLYTGPIEYHHTVTSNWGWLIPGTQLRVGPTTVVSNFVAMIDR